MTPTRPPSSTPITTRPTTPAEKPVAKAETASTSHVAQPQDGVDAPSTSPRRASAPPSGPTPPASPRNARSTGATDSPRGQLPEGMKVTGSIPLRNVTSLDRLPEGLKVAGSLPLGKTTKLIPGDPSQKK
jgi:hypothetical protein